MIDPEQRKKRQKRIGSSDAPAILGFDPWRTAADVYWSKITPWSTPTSEAMDIGNRLEPALCDFAAEVIGERIERNVLVWPDNAIVCANLDARVIGKPEAVECKYTSVADGFGEPGTDEVPEHVVVQCQHQAMVADLERVWVPVAMVVYRQLKFRLYCVRRNDELIEILRNEENRFWREHVELQVPPIGGSIPPLGALRAMRRAPESMVALTDEALKAWTDLDAIRQQKRAAEEAEEEAYARVLAQLGDSEAGVLPDGSMLTYMQQRGAPKCDAKMLKLEHPDLYQKYFTENAYRVLRLKKAKTK